MTLLFFLTEIFPITYLNWTRSKKHRFWSNTQPIFKKNIMVLDIKKFNLAKMNIYLPPLPCPQVKTDPKNDTEFLK